jgi:hypothetical protein
MLALQQRTQSWAAMRAAAEATLARLREFDPSEPRDDEGKWTSGGGGEGSEAKPAAGGKEKGKFKATDFNKAKVRLDPDTTTNPAKAEKFLEVWNDRVNEAPEKFRDHFLGGLDGTMRISYDDRYDKLVLNGDLQNDRGATIGTYTRNINLKDNTAYSAYFKLDRLVQHGNIGKKMLAANVAMYRKMGIDSVGVTANIDVGGYAWAKYGYVPTPAAWGSLSNQIRAKLQRSGGSGGKPAAGTNTTTPDSWDEISTDDQERIEQAWTEATRDDYLASEAENWRDSGQSLDDAKSQLADNFNTDRSVKWANAALTAWRAGREEDGEPNVPFSNDQILASITADYESGYDGRRDATFYMDADKLDEMQPEGFDPAQQTLPGITPIKPSDMLGKGVADEISDALVSAFNDEARDLQDSMDVPDFSDSVADYQSDSWRSMDDDDKYAWAERNGELPAIPIEDEEEEPADQGEMLPDQAAIANAALMKLASSSDPKAIWAIADSERGKQLLLGTGWSGVLNLKDKQSMDRFNAYVGKGK